MAVSKKLVWYTLPRDQGQICTTSRPQVAGAAEGTEGAGQGLVLRSDAFGLTWEIEDEKLGIIAEGVESSAPTVVEAIAIRKEKQRESASKKGAR